MATFSLIDVHSKGGEPTIGVTGNGCIFRASVGFVQFSCDHGTTWKLATGPLVPSVSSDPYLWVDPKTDRVFDLQQGPTVPTRNAVSNWLAWSDDSGQTWTANPLDFGTFPDVDHVKLATGPWTSAGLGALGRNTRPAYPNAVYFCTYAERTEGRGVTCYTSIDGGVTFPVGGVVEPRGGPQGAITVAPDGTVYVPPRVAEPEVAISKDNGQTWKLVTFGSDVGTADPRKNPEVATDTSSNAYFVWVGPDFRVHLSRSRDGGSTWDPKSLAASPENVLSTTFQNIQAGDPGRIAIAYLGSENSATNVHSAGPSARFDLYVTFSLDALDAEPTFTTLKLTSDPVQIGSICQLSEDCHQGDRNLLDFNDLSIDRDGRVYIAFTDGCTGACSSNPNASPADSRDKEGMVAILQSGPSLYKEKGNLTAFPS